MRLLRLSPAAFIHFGTTQELRELMTKEVEQFSFLDWKKCVSGREVSDYAVNNAIVEETCRIGRNCYIEDSYICGKQKWAKEVCFPMLPSRDR